MNSSVTNLGGKTIPALLVIIIAGLIFAFLENFSRRGTDLSIYYHESHISGTFARTTGASDFTRVGNKCIYPIGLRSSKNKQILPQLVSSVETNCEGDSSGFHAQISLDRKVKSPGDTNMPREDTANVSQFNVIADSVALKGKPDSTTTQQIHVESGARDSTSNSVDTLNLSEWLGGVREDHPQAEPFQPYHYPLFATDNVIQRNVTFDSTGRYVIVRQTIFGTDVRIPQEIPLQDYVRLAEKYNEQRVWNDLAHSYSMTNKQDELGALMQSMTNIDIPIPSNPVLSIFGPPRINLKIAGAVDIRGAWRNQKLDQQTLSQLGNVRNEPDFNQDVQINVNGTVGDKLNIGANWDTQNQFEYENQLKIKYTGYDDEIVKSVEAGNVSLSTPSSFIGSSQALFGIKSQMQLGPLTLTGLASQKKGQTKELTVSGGSQQQTFTLRVYNYATNHFFIYPTYIQYYEDYLQKPGQPYNHDLLVKDYQVYISVPGNQTNQLGLMRDGVAVMKLPPIESAKAFYDSLRSQIGIQNIPGEIESGKFVQLSPDQFSLDTHTGVLTLNSQVLPDQIVAIAFKIEGPTDSPADDETFGTFFNGDTSASRLVLELVKPANLIPSEKDAWQLMLKNIYSTGGLNLNQNSLKNVQILYQLPGQPSQDNIQGYNLLQVMGLDKTGAGGSGPPDGQFDWNPGIDIIPSTGEIVFPYLRPFDEAFKAYRSSTGQGIASPDSFAFKSAYDTTYDAAMNDAIHDRFVITGQYTSDVSSKYNLGFNLVQGSVQVLLNGVPLKPDIDYTVDYLTGDVNIRNPAALVPGADLKITYETNDIFQIASKSLVGLRGDYKVNDQTNLGITLMNFSQQTPNDKVRLGEEPISNLILGTDAGTSFNLPFVTRALDALPLIQTAAPSQISIHGEAAYMMPNPNTRTSPIPDDAGKSIAYIDDFEGAKKTIPLGISYSGWHFASPPAVDTLTSLYPGITVQQQTDFKGYMFWYNIIPSDVTVQQVWPNKNVPVDQQQQTVLNIEFDPSVRGQYNYSHNIDSTLKRNPQLSWAGMMRVLGANASDLLTQNINYIEIWMQVNQAPGNARMHIDLGQVSEDIFGDKTLSGHTEDVNKTGVLPSSSDDLGLDMLSDEQERKKYPWITDRPNDPSGDDYSWSPGSTDYSHVNGTEGNSVSEAGRLPDTEDLNNNGQLDLTDSYFEYVVKLDTTKNPYIAGGGHMGWYQYIIPLQDFYRKVGNPSLSVVQYIRVWFDGCSAPMRIRIADFNLVGNYWRTPNQSDSTMQVSVVNIEDNPDYTPPAPGLRPVDHTQATQTIYLNEQSLSLILNGLRDGDSRYAYKTFPRPLDVFHYGTMKVFVHGDNRFNYVDSTNYDAEFFVRFGSDTLNYYEYRQPIKPGWQDLTIDFARLTAIKQARDSANAVVPRIPAGPPGATYWLRGNPSLQSISYFQLGVANPENKGTPNPIYGTVWVDELRLINVDNTKGWAYSFTTSLQLADIGSLSFNFSRVDPYFHSLTQTFGNRITNLNWGISTSFSLDRLLPREWQGTSIPFTYSHIEGFGNPLYLPGSDILVSEAVKNREAFLISKGVSPQLAKAAADSLQSSSQSMRVADSWAIPSIRVVIPSTKWYVRDIVDNITLGFNWTGSHYRDPQTLFGNQWAWNFNAGYSVQLGQDLFWQPFSSRQPGMQQQPLVNTPSFSLKTWQLRYLPNSISLSMNAGRSLTIQQMRTQAAPILSPNFVTQRSGSINWKLTNGGILNPTIDYRFNVSSSLLYLELDSLGHRRSNSYVFSQIFLNNGIINFGRDYDFSQQFSLSTQPQLPFGLSRFADLQTGYSSAYGWTNSIQQGNFGRGARYAASFQIGTNLRLKSLTDPWFASGEQQAPQMMETRGHGRAEMLPTADTTSTQGKKNPALMDILRVAIKVPFLDFDNITINFSSSSNSQNGGLPSLRPGMGNFFRIPFIQESQPYLGPSQLYQLGLVSDPYSKLAFFKKKGFPFFGFETTPSGRVPSANITDNYSNHNSLDLKTSRQLWTGARIDLTWHVGWSYNRNMTFTTDAYGNIVQGSMTQVITGNIDRSFFTVPPVFVFSMLKSGIQEVATLYDNMKNDPNDTRTDDQKLSDAFQKGFESLPILTKIFGPYMPRLNYSFHWDGLEQLPMFKSFATRVSLDHAYNSRYTQSWHSSSGIGTVTDAQQAGYAFQPLIGLNIAFKNFWDGSMSGSINYNTSDQYTLTPSARTINESYTGELTLTATYSKRGFAIPFFGLNLKNDVDISFSYSGSSTSRKSYSSDNISSGGTPLDGMNRTTLELRFRYVVSQRVTAALFYRNTRVKPTIPGSLIPGTTTNEAGLDVHISIAG